MPMGSYRGSKSSMPAKAAKRMEGEMRMKKMNEAVGSMKKRMGPKLKGKDGDPFAEGMVKRAKGGMVKKSKKGC
jgi:hypothetical protein